MKVAQAVSYLESVNAIDPRDMSKCMFKLVRAAARRAHAEYPGMAGYYDPEVPCVRAEPWKYRFAPAYYTQTLPQSAKLFAMITARIPDPWANPLSLFSA